MFSHIRENRDIYIQTTYNRPGATSLLFMVKVAQKSSVNNNLTHKPVTANRKFTSETADSSKFVDEYETTCYEQ